jgi:hypothetical protein
MNERIKRYIIPVIVWSYTVVNICITPVLYSGRYGVSSSLLYAATTSSDAGSVVIKIKGEKVPPETITNLVAKPRLVTGFYPSEEQGGRIELTWSAPKDPEVFDVHPDTYVFSYIIKFDTSTRGYNLGNVDDLLAWWDDAQKVFTNHIWELPIQVKGQTFELYPLDFGIPAPEEKYRLTYGITDKIIITGLPKGEKIYIGVSSRDRYYNQSLPAVVETYVPAGIDPPSRVTDLVASYGGAGTIKLNWTSPANDRFSLFSSSGLYNIPDGRYAIAYSTALPETLDFYPEDINIKWPSAKVVYIDTSTLCFVPQEYKITGLQLQEGTTSIGYYFLLWTSDEWSNKKNWSLGSNLAGWGLVAPDYVRNIVVYSSASVDPNIGSYAVLSWVNSKDEDIPIEGVKIYYSTTNYTTNENYFVKLTTSPNQLVETQHIQLLPRHWYYYILLSYNSAGSRPWTTDVIAKTYTAYDLIPPDKVTNLTGLADVSDQDGVYISLNWTLPDGNLYQNKDFYIDGRIEVLYSSTSFTTDTALLTLSKNTTNVKLTGLQAYTTYFISIITADGGNNKSTSTITVYTPYDPYAPNPPKLLSYEVLSSTDEQIGSYIKFHLRNSNDRDLKEIRVYYSTSGYVKENYVVTGNISPGAEYDTYIKQLYPRTSYYFVFVAYDVTNRFSYDVREQIYIDKDTLAPDLPDNVTLVADAKPESQPYGSFINISFVKPDEQKYRNFDLVGYEIYASSFAVVPYEEPSAIHYVVNKETTSIDLLNLEQHTTYYVTIHSFDPVGNKSTSTVFTVFTWKDLVAPSTAKLEISSYTVSLVPEEGVSVKVNTIFGPEKDLNDAVVEVSANGEFSNIISSSVVKPLRPNLSTELLFNKLDVGTTYYIRCKVYDWSNNIAVSTISWKLNIQPDDTIPLEPVGLKAQIKENKLSITWQKVYHQYKVLNNEIEKFKGINGLGPAKPTTFELYKYKVMYKSELTDDNGEWVELTSLTPENNSCEVLLQKGYYKVVSYDITGNKNDSIIVNDMLNYYIYKNGVYIKLPKENGEQVANMLYYNTVVDYLEETKGKIIKVYSANFGLLNEEQKKIVFKDITEFANENIIGVKYKVENNKAKFVVSNKVFEVDVDKVATKVAFYVFDGKEYVRATTYVDKEKQVVYYRSKFLSKVQLRNVESTGEFSFVEAKPKVITPDTSPNENDIVFFVFNNPQGSEVKIKIFDVNSVLVWETTTRNDSSTPSSYVSWDGKDISNKYVLPGVYIYQVECEGKKYKGVITVAR